MTNDQFLEALKMLKPDPPKPDPKNELLKWLLPTLTGLAVYLMTGNQDRTENATVTLSSVTTQISNIGTSLTELKAQVTGMKTQLDVARVDPFTGRMASELEDRLELKIERLQKEIEDDQYKVTERVRTLENRNAVLQ